MKNKKIAHYFNSATDRKLPEQPGFKSEYLSPATYDGDRSKDVLNKRKDFALKMPLTQVNPTREMPFLSVGSQINEDEDLGALAPPKPVSKPQRPLGINYLAATVDPQGVS